MGKLVMSHVVSADHALAKPKRVSFALLRRHRRLVFSALGERLPSSEYLAAPRCWQAVVRSLGMPSVCSVVHVAETVFYRQVLRLCRS